MKRIGEQYHYASGFGRITPPRKRLRVIRSILLGCAVLALSPFAFPQTPKPGSGGGGSGGGSSALPTTVSNSSASFADQSTVSVSNPYNSASIVWVCVDADGKVLIPTSAPITASNIVWHFVPNATGTCHYNGTTNYAYPDATQAPSGTTDPASVVFAPVARYRMVDPWPADRFVIANDEFVGDDVDAWTLTTISGGGSAAAAASQMTLTASGSGAHLVLRNRAQPVAPYVYAMTRVSAWTSGDSPGVYVVKDTNNQASAYVDGGDNDYLKIRANTASQTATGTSTVVIAAGDEIMVVLCYPEVWAWANKANHGWFPVAKAVFSTSGTASAKDLRLDANLLGWRPAIGAVLATSNAASFDYLRSGYIGGVGLRDFKPVVDKTGRAIIRNNKAWFTGTIASGNEFLTNHMCMISVDLNSYEVRIVSHFFFKPSATETTAMYGGQYMLDTQTGLWRLFVNGWGYESGGGGAYAGGTQNGRVQLWGASTTNDLFADGAIHILDATALVTDSSFTMYDNSVRYDALSGTWLMALTKTDAATAWTTFAPSLMSTSGDPLAGSWATVQDGDAAYVAEGTVWLYANSTWWIVAGGYLTNDGARLYTADLAKPTGGTPGQSDRMANWEQWASIPEPTVPHFAAVPFYRGGTVKYMMLTWDGSLLLSGVATGGGIVIEVGQ